MENPNFKIGMTAIEVVVELVRIQLEIRHLSFDIYTPSPNVKEMERTPTLARLLKHYPSKPCFSWRRDYITSVQLNDAVSSLEENEVLAVRSDIFIPMDAISGLLAGEQKCHIPMMDFISEESTQNLSRIKDFLKIIKRTNGVILSSGRSYHYYGLGLLDEWQWQNFLGDCGLSQLADARYLFHRFKDGCGVLRISACPLRPKIPTVITIL